MRIPFVEKEMLNNEGKSPSLDPSLLIVFDLRFLSGSLFRENGDKTFTRPLLPWVLGNLARVKKF